MPGADGPANQAQCRKSDSGSHAPYLPVAALQQANLEPGFGNIGAVTDRWIALPEFRRRFDLPGAQRTRRPILQLDADLELAELCGGGGAFDLRPIRLDDLGPWLADSRLHAAVVSQQQQAFAVEVEATGRIHVGYADKFGQRRPVAVIAKL